MQVSEDQREFYSPQLNVYPLRQQQPQQKYKSSKALTSQLSTFNPARQFLRQPTKSHKILNMDSSNSHKRVN